MRLRRSLSPHWHRSCSRIRKSAGTALAFNPTAARQDYYLGVRRDFLKNAGSRTELWFPVGLVPARSFSTAWWEIILYAFDFRAPSSAKPLQLVIILAVLCVVC